jgi:hypothetical protein
MMVACIFFALALQRLRPCQVLDVLFSQSLRNGYVGHSWRHDAGNVFDSELQELKTLLEEIPRLLLYLNLWQC